eukprot:TRINITY_DN1569_c0_g1_i1.p1 TRINITY_DN1569_c0_g1~~TRINITY_DN1569_c0_g1_i1.p1  ORF type:complete len:227 (+),score=79.04 TRINITY_DN1569_c0_g1_i1:93-773(+)
MAEKDDKAAGPPGGPNWRHATTDLPKVEQPLTAEEIRARVLALYTKHRPGQAKHVDSLMQKFKGRELEVLIRAETLFNDSGAAVTADDIDPSKKRPRLAVAERWSGVGMQPVPGLRGSRFQVLKNGREGGRIASKGCKCYLIGHGAQVHTGKKFWKADDASPFEMKLGAGEVAQGLDLGLVGMREGEERKIIVSSEDGYGQEGFEPMGIAPGATLCYEVKLHKVGH